MIFGILFAFWRFMEIITLIPTLGMLAYFVKYYNDRNELTPEPLLVLFIISVVAAAWAIATLFTYHRSRENSLFVAFIDLCFVGALIAAVYLLRYIGHANCVNWHSSGSSADLTLGSWFGISVSGAGANVNKSCAMIKASWVFAIMNILFFFFTACLAAFVGNSGNRSRNKKEVYVRETHYSRGGGSGRRRSGSHRSHRSSHSGRHAYV